MIYFSFSGKSISLLNAFEIGNPASAVIYKQAPTSLGLVIDFPLPRELSLIIQSLTDFFLKRCQQGTAKGHKD